MKYLCIHGHFYQPPRENPWLEAIELQDSAYPYHDWNERITAECYATNAAARILARHDTSIRVALVRHREDQTAKVLAQPDPRVPATEVTAPGSITAPASSRRGAKP